jgi:hypothetical protein
MQRISESAESLFGDLHKPFSTASTLNRHKREYFAAMHSAPIVQ